MSDNTNNESGGDAILEQYFGYKPSVPLAIVATVLFFLVSVPLFFQSYRYRNRLTYVLPLTGLVECAGYIVRLYMIQQPSLSVYVVMSLFIILAPNALAFANYKVLGKIIQAKTGQLRLTPVSASDSSSSPQLKKVAFRLPYLMTPYGEVHGARLASFFFLSDIAAILLQGMGGGMQAGSNPDLGTDVLLFGLASQLFFFGVFTLLAIYVFASPLYQSMARSDGVGAEYQSASSSASSMNKSVLTASEYDHAFYGLFATIGFLYVRNIYRVIEFTMGYRGYLATSETFMYLFDTLLIFIAFLLYVRFNFAEFLAKADTQPQVQPDLAAIVDDSRSNCKAEKVNETIITVQAQPPQEQEP